MTIPPVLERQDGLSWADVVIAPARWGPLVISTDVDDAIEAVLREWMPRYLERVVAERELDDIEPPRQYDTAFVPEELLDNQLPALVAETARMDTAAGGSARSYEGTWRTEVRSVVRGKRGRHTRHLASLYEGTVRRLITQQATASSAGPPLSWLHYTGMRLEEVPGDRTRGRYLLCAVSTFQVKTDEIVDPTGGPYPEPLVTSHHIDVLKEGLT